MNGEDGTIECTAEQMSWTKPGRVRAAERVAPPIVASASYTRTDRPARASVMAAARPFGPEPMTIASSAGEPLVEVTD